MGEERRKKIIAALKNYFPIENTTKLSKSLGVLWLHAFSAQ